MTIEQKAREAIRLIEEISDKTTAQMVVDLIVIDVPWKVDHARRAAWLAGKYAAKCDGSDRECDTGLSLVRVSIEERMDR